MDFIKITYFLQVAESKNISKAARLLYISQQSLSKAIQNIEKELGKSIFERTANGVKLTADGEYLYQHYKPLYEHYLNVQNLINKHFDSQQGKLCFSFVPGFFRSLSPNVLIEFKQLYPNIQLEYSEMPDLICEESVLNGDYQFGCSLAPANLDDLKFIPLKSEQLFLILHKDNPLATQKMIDFDWLKYEKFACFNKEFRLNQIVMNECKAHGFEPDIIFESAEVELLIDVVRMNLATFICVEHVIEQINDPNIRFIPFKNDNLKWIIGVIYRQHKQLDYLAESFINFIQENGKANRVKN